MLEEREARRDDAAVAQLSGPTDAPRDVGRFTPDLYPQAPPLVAASGPAPSDATVAADFATFLAAHLRGNHQRIGATLARFYAPDAVERLPDAGVRAALLSLTGTLGDPLIEPFLAGELPVTTVTYGEPADPGRVVGPPVDGAAGVRVVNDRYRFEPFALLSGSLLHDLLHHEPAVSDPEETVLHGLLAAVHLQVISRSPELAGTTELARRQNSLALSLLCSRVLGRPGARLVAPDGPGTIPGGAPTMQTPDFWSIPFVPDRPEPAPPTDAFAAFLDSLLGASPDRRPPLVDEDLARLLDDHVLTRELLPFELMRAGVALTVFDPPEPA